MTSIVDTPITAREFALPVDLQAYGFVAHVERTSRPGLGARQLLVRVLAETDDLDYLRPGEVERRVPVDARPLPTIESVVSRMEAAVAPVEESLRRKLVLRQKAAALPPVAPTENEVIPDPGLAFEQANRAAAPAMVSEVAPLAPLQTEVAVTNGAAATIAAAPRISLRAPLTLAPQAPTATEYVFTPAAEPPAPERVLAREPVKRTWRDYVFRREVVTVCVLIILILVGHHRAFLLRLADSALQSVGLSLVRSGQVTVVNSAPAASAPAPAPAEPSVLARLTEPKPAPPAAAPAPAPVTYAAAAPAGSVAMPVVVMAVPPGGIVVTPGGSAGATVVAPVASAPATAHAPVQAAATAAASRVTPGAATAAPVDPDLPPLAPKTLNEFRHIIAGYKLSGLVKRAPARVLINGRLVREGGTVDLDRGIRFIEYDASLDVLVFENAQGIRLLRQY